MAHTYLRTNFLGVLLVALLGLAPAGTALLTSLLRTTLGRTAGRLPLAALLGGRLAARGTSLGRHGSNDWGLRDRNNCCELDIRERQHTKNGKCVRNTNLKINTLNSTDTNSRALGNRDLSRHELHSANLTCGPAVTMPDQQCALGEGICAPSIANKTYNTIATGQSCYLVKLVPNQLHATGLANAEIETTQTTHPR